MGSNVFCLLAGTLCLLFAGALVLDAQSPDQSFLKDRRINLSLDKAPLGMVFECLMIDFDVPIGFEESINDRNHDDFSFDPNAPQYVKRTIQTPQGLRYPSSVIVYQPKNHWFNIHADNEPLSNVLDMLVKQMGDYKWEINDDVVNIFPVSGRDEKFKLLLDLKISKFEMSRPFFLIKIRDKIVKLPELTQFLAANDLRMTLYRSGDTDNLIREASSELNFSNVSLRDLLNGIAKIKRGGWILKESDLYGPNSRVIDIQI